MLGEYDSLYLDSFDLCNEVNHTKTSHDRFGEVFCNAATCLIRPNIFGPQVTALDRFHCIMFEYLGLAYRDSEYTAVIAIMQ